VSVGESCSFFVQLSVTEPGHDGSSDGRSEPAVLVFNLEQGIPLRADARRYHGEEPDWPAPARQTLAVAEFLGALDEEEP
jgi:hypothetical protein